MKPKLKPKILVTLVFLPLLIISLFSFYNSLIPLCQAEVAGDTVYRGISSNWAIWETMDELDFQRVRGWKFNAMGFMVFWASIERNYDQVGVYDQTRLNNIRSQVDMAKAEGLTPWISLRIANRNYARSESFGYNWAYHDYANYDATGRARYADFVRMMGEEFSDCYFILWHFPYHMYQPNYARIDAYHEISFPMWYDALREENSNLAVFVPIHQGYDSSTTSKQTERYNYIRTEDLPSIHPYNKTDDLLWHPCLHPEPITQCGTPEDYYNDDDWYDEFDADFEPVMTFAETYPDCKFMTTEFNCLKIHGSCNQRPVNPSRVEFFEKVLQKMDDLEAGWLYYTYEANPSWDTPQETDGSNSIVADLLMEYAEFESDEPVFEPWQTDFELGNLSDWDSTYTDGGESSSAEVTSAITYAGSYAGNFTTNGTAYTTARARHEIRSSDEIWLKSYVQYEVLPDNGSRIMSLVMRDSNEDFLANIGIYVNGTGRYWVVRVDVAGNTYALDNAISAGTWYCMEFYFNVTTSGNATLIVDNTLKLSNTGDFSSMNSIKNVYAYIYIGDASQTGARSVFHDDFRVDIERIGCGSANIFFTAEHYNYTYSAIPLEDVKVNGTHLTDTAGSYIWRNLAYNTIYCFVIEPPTGYYPAWVLDVEGKYHWNNTHYILTHNITEGIEHYLSVYFFATSTPFVQNVSQGLKMSDCMKSFSDYGETYSYTVESAGWAIIDGASYYEEPYLSGVDILEDGVASDNATKSYDVQTDITNITFSMANTVTLHFTHDKATGIPANTWFWLPTYDIYMIFSQQVQVNDLYRSNAYWYFSDYRLQVQNSNITLSQFFTNDKLMFNLSTSSSAIVKVFIPSSFRDDGNPASVDGASDWSYDEGTRTLLVTSPDPEVTINWKAKAGQPIPVYPYEQPVELPIIQFPDPLVQLSRQGLIVLMGGLGVVAVGGIVASVFTTVKKRKISRQPKGTVKVNTNKLNPVSKRAKSPTGYTGRKKKRST